MRQKLHADYIIFDPYVCYHRVYISGWVVLYIGGGSTRKIAFLLANYK